MRRLFSRTAATIEADEDEKMKHLGLWPSSSLQGKTDASIAFALASFVVSPAFVRFNAIIAR